VWASSTRLLSFPAVTWGWLTALISQGWEEKTGGKLEFVPDPEEIVQRALAHIDGKRAELGLAKHDPTRFGRSGDGRFADLASLSMEERMRRVYG
jgi:hypothetical protein